MSRMKRFMTGLEILINASELLLKMINKKQTERFRVRKK